MAATLLLVRPQAQALRQQAELARLGVASLPFCVLDTVADAAALAALPAQAGGCHGVLFVSPSAIDIAWPALAPTLAPGTRLACVGQASADRLAALGAANVIHPAAGNDSDALLAQPALQAVAGQRWLIVRGDGGRSQLGDTLAARGADVAYATLYRQQASTPDWATFDTLAAQGRLAGLLLASSAAATALFAAAGPARHATLAAQTCYTLHPRIASCLQQLGAGRVRLCDGSSQALAALLA